MEKFEKAYNQYHLILGELASEPLLHTLAELDVDINRLKSGLSARIPLATVNNLHTQRDLLFSENEDEVLDAMIYFCNWDPYGYYRLYEIVNVEMEY